MFLKIQKRITFSMCVFNLEIKGFFRRRNVIVTDILITIKIIKLYKNHHKNKGIYRKLVKMKSIAGQNQKLQTRVRKGKRELSKSTIGIGGAIYRTFYKFSFFLLFSLFFYLFPLRTAIRRLCKFRFPLAANLWPCPLTRTCLQKIINSWWRAVTFYSSKRIVWMCLLLLWLTERFWWSFNLHN